MLNTSAISSSLCFSSHLNHPFIQLSCCLFPLLLIPWIVSPNQFAKAPCSSQSNSSWKVSSCSLPWRLQKTVTVKSRFTILFLPCQRILCVTVFCLFSILSFILFSPSVFQLSSLVKVKSLCFFFLVRHLTNLWVGRKYKIIIIVPKINLCIYKEVLNYFCPCLLKR